MADENVTVQKKSIKKMIGAFFAAIKNFVLDVILKSW
jgi:hypothetical protein